MTKSKSLAPHSPPAALPKVSPAQRKQLINTDWTDAGSFEKARTSLALSPAEFALVMKQLVTPKDFRRWKCQTEALGHLKKETKKSHRAPRR